MDDLKPRYIVVKHFHDGVLKGVCVFDDTNVFMPVGLVTKEYEVTAWYDRMTLEDSERHMDGTLECVPYCGERRELSA